MTRQYLFGEGNFLYSYRRFGAPLPHGGRRQRRAVRGLGAACPGRQRDRPFQRLGPPRPIRCRPTAPASGSFSSPTRRRSSLRRERRTSIRSNSRCWITGSTSRNPYAFYAEEPPGTASRIWPLDNYAWGDGSWVAERAGRQKLTRASEHLRGPPGQLAAGSGRQPFSGVPGNWRASWSPTCRRWAYTHIEILPITEHPFGRLLGLSEHRLFRADQPPRRAGRLQAVRRSLPPQRRRRDSGLGAGPLSQGCARTGLLRRRAAL